MASMTSSSYESSNSIILVMVISSIFIFFNLAPNVHAVDRFLPLSDVDNLEFPLNLEFLEAEFFLFGAFGYGLDQFAPELTGNGPPPVGPKIAKLSPLIRDIVAQFGLQEVGHIRAIKNTVRGFPRPPLDLTVNTFATLINTAFGKAMYPPFNPYADELNYLIACYIIPYVGLTGYVGATPRLRSPTARRLVAGLLGAESGQDAVIRTLLFERAKQKVHPYGITVEEFANRISDLRNRLGNAGLKDEGLAVPLNLGAEGRIHGNVLSLDNLSLAYDRTPVEVLRIVYSTGSESVPGGFYPNGGYGVIARSYLRTSQRLVSEAKP